MVTRKDLLPWVLEGVTPSKRRSSVLEPGRHPGSFRCDSDDAETMARRVLKAGSRLNTALEGSSTQDPPVLPNAAELNVLHKELVDVSKELGDVAAGLRNQSIPCVKRREEGVRNGFFGAINLLGPRDVTQRPRSKYWNDQLTVVQLRYTFMTETAPGAYLSDATGVHGLRELDVGRAPRAGRREVGVGEEDRAVGAEGRRRRPVELGAVAGRDGDGRARAVAVDAAEAPRALLAAHDHCSRSSCRQL